MSQRIDIDELNQVCIDSIDPPAGHMDAAARWMANVNPSTVGGLIDRIRELERALESAACSLHSARFRGAEDQARSRLEKGAVRRG